MPLVLSSHFSSTSVLHSTTSSCTSCTSCLVQHSDSYSVLQISGPCTSQSFTRGVLQTVAVSLKAICSYSMKQFSLQSTILHQRGPTDGGGLVEGDLLVLDEAVLPEVLLAVLLLLGLVVGGVGGVAPPVVGVVALHHVVVLRLLH